MISVSGGNIMHFDQLHYFIIVYQKKNLSYAANLLNISRQRLSASIKELESELGIQLFLRGKRGVIATSAGENFYQFAQNTLAELEVFKQSFKKNRSFDSLTIVFPKALLRKYGKNLTSSLSNNFDIEIHLISQDTYLESEFASMAPPEIFLLDCAKHTNWDMFCMEEYIPENYLVKNTDVNLNFYVIFKTDQKLSKQQFITENDLNDNGYSFCYLKSACDYKKMLRNQTFNSWTQNALLFEDYNLMLEALKKEKLFTLDVVVTTSDSFDNYPREEFTVKPFIIPSKNLNIMYNPVVPKEIITFIKNFFESFIL